MPTQEHSTKEYKKLGKIMVNKWWKNRKPWEKTFDSMRSRCKCKTNKYYKKGIKVEITLEQLKD